MEVARWKTFGENIGKLSHGNKFDNNIAMDNFLSDKMVVNLDVFGSSVKYQVGSHGKGREIVTPNERRIGQEKP